MEPCKSTSYDDIPSSCAAAANDTNRCEEMRETADTRSTREKSKRRSLLYCYLPALRSTRCERDGSRRVEVSRVRLDG